MTICIAAISEENKIVAVTDKMLTLDRPITTTFEVSDNNKVAKLTDKTLALFAGDVTHANEILKKAQADIGTPAPTKVHGIAKIMRDAFSKHWESVISNYLFMRYRLNLADFTKNQGAFDVDLIKQINEIISKFEINVQILIAGIDNSPKIYYIDKAGSVIEQTTIGYASIGSGEIHATLSLIESEYNHSFKKPRSLYCLLEAKKRAEYDPGVGEHCDIAVIDNRGFKQYDVSKVQEILQIFNRSRANIKKSKQRYYDKLGGIRGL